MPAQVIFVPLIAKSCPEACREKPQRQHILFLNLCLHRQPLFCLLLHERCNRPADVVLPEEAPELPEPLDLVVPCHLVVHHAGRQRRDQCAPEYQAQGHADDVVNPLERVDCGNVHCAQSELRHAPVERDDVLVWKGVLQECDALAVPLFGRFDPAHARVAWRRAAHGEPSAADEVVDPEHAAHDEEAAQRYPGTVGEAGVHKVLDDSDCPHHA
mmetsp:Transcript_90793/g.220298  ORF Transcript_90793/g.220298 Transcript_90793/m.220298 type:complete len:214 (-) Transcript_90793:18-659(-)